MEEDTEVVLRYRDGHTERVLMRPVDATREMLDVRRENGERAEVPFSLIKAAFFPRTDPDAPLEEPSGSMISIEFSDGEVIRGVANYNPARNGFFLFPDDRSKSDRIFVVNAAIMSIEVEKL